MWHFSLTFCKWTFLHNIYANVSWTGQMTFCGWVVNWFVGISCLDTRHFTYLSSASQCLLFFFFIIIIIIYFCFRQNQGYISWQVRQKKKKRVKREWFFEIRKYFCKHKEKIYVLLCSVAQKNLTQGKRKVTRSRLKIFPPDMCKH